MHDDDLPANASDARHFLEIYLRDHHAGSVAGLSLVTRCREENAGTSLGSTLAELEREIAEDRRTLDDLMGRLGVTPSPLKTAMGAVTERIMRFKRNGRWARYSPLSRLVELEGLAAGIFTKRNLWRALRAVAEHDATLDAAELDRLIAGATSQYERVLDAHARAAVLALSAAATAELRSG